MTVLLLVAGAVLIAIAVLDSIATAATAGRGGGPLTRHLGRLLWRLLLRGGRHEHSRLLVVAGPLVLVATVLVWVLLLWGGWTLVFSADEQAVVEATTELPASLPARTYYAGFVVFTLGVGDYVAPTGVWQVLTAVASFIGLSIITLSITYLVSVVSAAVSRRRLALSISLLGLSGADVVRLHWDGSGVSSQLGSRTQSLETSLLQTTQQHLAYPVLHYFSAAERTASTPYMLAVLDDALLLLEAAVDPQARPEPAVLVPLRRALEHYADTVEAVADHDVGPPPLPDLQGLREAGVPVVDEAAYDAAAQDHHGRRTALHRLVRSDGRGWPQTPS